MRSVFGIAAAWLRRSVCTAAAASGVAGVGPLRDVAAVRNARMGAVPRPQRQGQSQRMTMLRVRQRVHAGVHGVGSVLSRVLSLMLRPVLILSVGTAGMIHTGLEIHFDPVAAHRESTDAAVPARQSDEGRDHRSTCRGGGDEHCHSRNEGDAHQANRHYRSWRQTQNRKERKGSEKKRQHHGPALSHSHYQCLSLSLSLFV